MAKLPYYLHVIYPPAASGRINNIDTLAKLRDHRAREGNFGWSDGGGVDEYNGGNSVQISKQYLQRRTIIKGAISHDELKHNIARLVVIFHTSMTWGR